MAALGVELFTQSAAVEAQPFPVTTNAAAFGRIRVIVCFLIESVVWYLGPCRLTIATHFPKALRIFSISGESTRKAYYGNRHRSGLLGVGFPRRFLTSCHRNTHPIRFCALYAPIASIQSDLPGESKIKEKSSSQTGVFCADKETLNKGRYSI